MFTVIGIILLMIFIVYFVLKIKRVDLKKIHNESLKFVSEIEKIGRQEKKDILSPREALEKKREILKKHNS